MIRTAISAVLSLWLVTGCATLEPETLSDAPVPASEQGFLRYCDDVLYEIDRVYDGLERVVASEDLADLHQVRSAATRLGTIRTLAMRQLPLSEQVDGQWLVNIGDTGEYFVAVMRLSEAAGFENADEEYRHFERAFTSFQTAIKNAERACAEVRA
jgi:hypothetical protein